MPNTQPISAEMENTTTTFTPLIFNFTIPEVNLTKSKFEYIPTESEDNIVGLSIEKYLSSTINGPWDKADDLLGVIDVTPHGGIPYMYYKVVLNNTGNTDLLLTLNDVYDGKELDLEQFLEQSLPSAISAGDSYEFSYRLPAYEGVHANIIYVEGLFGEMTIQVVDVALYDGYRPVTQSSSTIFREENPEETPHFVVPEYNMGVLGGLMCMLLAYLYSSNRKNQLSPFS